MEDIIDHRKWQMALLKRVELTAISISLVLLGINIATEEWTEALTGFACIVWFLLLRVGLRKPQHFPIRLHGFITFGFVACIFSIVTMGYLRSNAMIWLPAIPAVAAISGSRQSGKIWLALCLTAIVVIAIIDPESSGKLKGSAIRFANFTALTVLLTLACLHFRSHSDAEVEARIRVEKAIMEANKRFHYMIKGNQSALWDWIDLKATDAYWSPQLYEILGYEDGEIPANASTFIEHIADEDRETFLEKVQEVLHAKTSDRFSYIIRLNRKDGSKIWVRSSGFIVRSEDGTAIRIIGSIEDLTELKEKELALQAAKEAAELANSAKTSFLSHMSHEMRTPLTGILGYAELLMKAPPGSEQHDYAAVIVDGCRSLIQLINDILDYAKIESGKMDIRLEPTDVHALVEEVAKLFAINLKRKGLEFRLRSQLQGKLYRVDRFRVRQVLTNLIGNAIKFTDKGWVAVDIGEVPDNSMRIQVQDTGRGIPLDDQERIFDSFQQVASPQSNSLGGSGLGLTITRQLVRLMGGDITVRSAEGKGSTFDLYFKAQAIGTIDQSQSAREAPADDALHPLSVLVVEDNELNRCLFIKILKDLGVNADSATNGEEAILAFKNKIYDLVFMDINMPKLDGLAATRKLRELYPSHGMLIYGISAYAYEEDKQKALAAGMNGYLTKPFTIQIIREVLTTCSPRSKTGPQL